MRVDLFDFDLPEERIALRPASPARREPPAVVRPGETLLDRGVARSGRPAHTGDVLVFNDTRVIPAVSRACGIAPAATGQRCEGDAAFARGARSLARLRPTAKRLAIGDRIRFGPRRRGPARSAA